jgi:hypothetical protein
MDARAVDESFHQGSRDDEWTTGIWKASMKFGNWRKILGRIVACAGGGCRQHRELAAAAGEYIWCRLRHLPAAEGAGPTGTAANHNRLA